VATHSFFKRAKNYYTHIDGLRALAVICVFLCHLDFSFFSGGFVGVDVFFVISGFLITNIITQQLASSEGFSFLTFYERRIKRIFPALFFTLLISFIFGIILLNAASFKVFGHSLRYSALSISNIFFKNQSGYFDIFSQSSPLLHTWSLSVEEQFYLFFPIILFLGHKLKKTLPIIFVVFIISFLLNLHYQNTRLIELYYLVQYRAFEFCIGAILVFLVKYERTSSVFLKELLCLSGTILVISTVFLFKSTTLFPGYNALLPCFGAAFIIYAGTAKYTGSIYRFFLCRKLGLISYSLYLIHWPMIIFFKTYNQDMGLSFAISFKEKIIIIVLAIIGSCLMYYFIEQPFRKNQNSTNPNPQIKPIVQGLTLALCMTLLGHFIYHNHGWTWRVRSSNELAKIKDISDYHTKYWGGADFSGGLIHQGKTKKAQLVLLGDSHAGMLDEGILHKIAFPDQITFFTASGGGAGKYASSLLLPGITRIDKEQQLFDDSARKAYKEALSHLHEQGVLILSSSWSAQLNIAGVLKNHHSLNINTALMSSYMEYQPLFKSIDKLNQLLGKRKLIIIGDVPGSQFKPILCLDNLRWFPQPTTCSLADSQGLNKGALNVNKALAMYASKRANVYFLNPYDIFCKNGICKSVDPSGRPYYSDGAHLSKLGSKFLIGNLKKDIMSILHST
jgi:peptidoglycan/LPS O-acetylase OafA/YrhL